MSTRMIDPENPNLSSSFLILHSFNPSQPLFDFLVSVCDGDGFERWMGIGEMMRGEEFSFEIDGDGVGFEGMEESL